MNQIGCSALLGAGVLAAGVLAGCASVQPDALAPGASAEQIRAQMGAPSATHTLPGGVKRLEFQASGARTFMLDVDASGTLLRSQQVRNEASFRSITAGMTPEQVRAALGQPDDVSHVGRQRDEVWSWNFRNLECQWFQLGFGSDARTSGGGAMALTPPCLRGGGGK
jgi:outer membrane protein assembly factor BamE (lipoprotein component of BamABCDE complex)